MLIVEVEKEVVTLVVKAGFNVRRVSVEKGAELPIVVAVLSELDILGELEAPSELVVLNELDILGELDVLGVLDLLRELAREGLLLMMELKSMGKRTLPCSLFSTLAKS